MQVGERLQVLLLSDLGGGETKPLTTAQYRQLRKRVQACGRPEVELDGALLRGLGYDETQTAQILALLCRNPQPWLTGLEHNGICPLGDQRAAYPQRLRMQLGETAPPLLYECGELSLLERTVVSVVGSREMTAGGSEAAAAAGRWIAAQGHVLCTGGAAGVDETALETCLEAGGSAILCLPAEMISTIRRRLKEVNSRRMLLLSAAPTSHFHPALALERNRWIHALGRAVIVCQCRVGRGGSWRGSAENCRNHWSPVFVSSDGSAGAGDLLSRGAQPLDWNALQNVLP